VCEADTSEGCLLQQSGWMASLWQGLRLLLASVPQTRWQGAAAAAHRGYLAAM
jgi:hypothetical protein